MKRWGSHIAGVRAAFSGDLHEPSSERRNNMSDVLSVIFDQWDRHRYHACPGHGSGFLRSWVW